MAKTAKKAKSSKQGSAGARLLLFLICFFFGWFGLDKLYMGGTWKIMLVKFLLTCIGIGALWNLYDMICACIGRYKLNPFK